ncbi:DUF3551 domain-containing protein [Bradyrhizobium prioriisuperbiae]|uniref:DUF3551 domain-containing protein n=1 Tax=Bradyrhizobium prioriisuperbiae TaxID=2854389 RepID=UPI0028EB17BA|nr:DUF3551 domain-containing protein [Bradyrhizobium prioritasuperba]
MTQVKIIQVHTRRIIMPLLFAAASAATLLGPTVTTPAHAEENGWCLVQDDQARCDYTSFQQCRRTGQGLGASCTENPRITPRMPTRAVSTGSR